MEYVYVLVAGLAGFIFGAVWYGVFGKQWQALTGVTEEQIKPANSKGAFAIGIVGNILAAGMLRHALATSGVVGAGGALVSGLGVGLFIVAPFVALNYAFAKRPRALILIDAGHAVGAMATIGLVLGLLY